MSDNQKILVSRIQTLLEEEKQIMDYYLSKDCAEDDKDYEDRLKEIRDKLYTLNQQVFRSID